MVSICYNFCLLIFLPFIGVSRVFLLPVGKLLLRSVKSLKSLYLGFWKKKVSEEVFLVCAPLMFAYSPLQKALAQGALAY